MAESNYELIGRFFGRDNMKRLGAFLTSGGFMVSAETLAGLYVVGSILASLLVSLLFVYAEPLRSYIFRFCLMFLRPLATNYAFFVPAFAVVLAFLLTFIFIGVCAYVLVLLSADTRRSKVEEVLPDFLILASANARAGMTVDQAIWHAAKPEFGLLSDEVKVVAKRSFGGVPFDQALDHLSVSFDSKIIRRTVNLIKQGLASGSKIAVILERTASDARDMQIIKKEISASLLMYVIFIVFAAAVGTPFLFAVSAKLISLMETVFTQIPVSSPGGSALGGSMAFIHPSAPIVTSSQFFIFVFASLLITSVCSSLLIGVIQKGNKREGIKYLPFILIVGILLFFAVFQVIGTFVSGLGGGG